MHAVMFRVNIKDREAAEKFLKDELVPMVSRAPGFVSGHWVNVGGDKGRSMAIFESEDSAKQAAERAQPPEAAVEVEHVEIGEVIASA